MAALAANRAGKLTEEQQLDIRGFLMPRRTLITVLPFAAILAVSYEARDVGLAPVYAGIAIAIPVILFITALAVVRATFGPMLADVDAGVVETVTGELAGSPGKGFSISGRRIRVTLPAADGLRTATGRLHVYVLPKSSLVVGFEPA